MLYKFKSRATADLIMLEPNGRQLVQIMGKTPGQGGIVTAEQIPGAIAAIEAAIAQALRAIADFARLEAALRSIRGIGPATAATLIALMPELGTIGRRQAAALAGLAPHPRQSGANDAYRPTRGGRPELKQALFMPAITAARRDPAMKLAYQRLIANGKKPIVAVTAIMRRIIVIANARARDASNQSN